MREKIMLDLSNNFDILNSSVRSTDFLCQNAPLVCAVEPTVLLTDAETGAFYWRKKDGKI